MTDHVSRLWTADEKLPVRRTRRVERPRGVMEAADELGDGDELLVVVAVANLAGHVLEYLSTVVIEPADTRRLVESDLDEVLEQRMDGRCPSAG